MYAELVKLYDMHSQMGEQASHVKLREIGAELRQVIQTMETKGEQVAILKDIIASSSPFVSRAPSVRLVD